jgi:hypothetical protein
LPSSSAIPYCAGILAGFHHLRRGAKGCGGIAVLDEEQGGIVSGLQAFGFVKQVGQFPRANGSR